MLTKRVIMEVFSIGTGRFNRIKNNIDYMPQSIKKVKRQFNLKDFVEEIQTEGGKRK